MITECETVAEVSMVAPGDFPRVMDLLASFKQEANLPIERNDELACSNWARLIASGVGVIIGLRNRHGGLDGALGATLVPDLYDGALVAQECFWYVDRTARGRGFLLLRAFEEWARAQGASRFLLAHMHTLMPDRLASLYERMGYARLETHYIKCL